MDYKIFILLPESESSFIRLLQKIDINLNCVKNLNLYERIFKITFMLDFKSKFIFSFGFPHTNATIFHIYIYSHRFLQYLYHDSRAP